MLSQLEQVAQATQAVQLLRIEKIRFDKRARSRRNLVRSTVQQLGTTISTFYVFGPVVGRIQLPG